MFRNLHPLSLCVAISSTFCLPVYAATTILPGVIFENTGYFTNYDRLDNQGHLINTGTIDNLYANYTYGAPFNNWGVTDNSGRLNFYQNSSLNNYGLFNNNISGWVDLQTGSNFLNTGVFNNNGNIFGQYNARLPNSRLINTNTLNNYRDIRNVDINNAGAINNQYLISSDSILNSLGGVINNLASGWVEALKKVTNYGILNNDGQLTLSTYTNERSLLENGGTINNRGFISAPNNYGADINNSGVFNNSGQIEAGNDLVINNSGTFNNGLVSDWRPGITSHGTRLEINNSGVFNNNLSINANNLLVNNSGIFENNNTIHLRVLNNQIGGMFNNEQGGGLFFNNSNNYPQQPPEFNNVGEFNNNSVITIAGNGQFVLNNTGVFNQIGHFDNQSRDFILNNDGTFNNGLMGFGSGSSIRFYGNAKLYNNGVFNNSNGLEGDNSPSSVIVNAGVLNSAERGAIRNFGSVINTGILNVADNMESIRFSNDATGIVNNARGWGGANNGVVVHDFINQGIINNSIGAHFTANAISAINNGVINNNGSFYSNGLENSGVINNSGWMYSNRVNNSGVINNDGTFSAQNLVSSGLVTGIGYFNTATLVITETGTLAPGNMLGQGMTIIGNLDMGGTLAVNVFSGRLDVFGNVILGTNSILDVSFYDISYLTLGQTFDLVSAYDITGGFGDFYYDTLFDNNLALQWEVLEGYGMGDLLRVSVVSSVPVPAAVWLFMSGLAGLIGVSRRRKPVLH